MKPRTFWTLVAVVMALGFAWCLAGPVWIVDGLRVRDATWISPESDPVWVAGSTGYLRGVNVTWEQGESNDVRMVDSNTIHFVLNTNYQAPLGTNFAPLCFTNINGTQAVFVVWNETNWAWRLSTNL